MKVITSTSIFQKFSCYFVPNKLWNQKNQSVILEKNSGNTAVVFCLFSFTRIFLCKFQAMADEVDSTVMVRFFTFIFKKSAHNKTILYVLLETFQTMPDSTEMESSVSIDRQPSPPSADEVIFFLYLILKITWKQRLTRQCARLARTKCGSTNARRASIRAARSRASRGTRWAWRSWLDDCLCMREVVSSTPTIADGDVVHGQGDRQLQAGHQLARANGRQGDGARYALSREGEHGSVGWSTTRTRQR